MLRTNIELDEKLIGKALRLTKLKTKKELVNYAVAELVNKLERRKVLELEGKVAWTGSLDEMRKERI
jgi:Arc/MetJ family transcription regulator